MIESTDLYKEIPWAKQAGLRLVKVRDTEGHGPWLYVTKNDWYCPHDNGVWFGLDAVYPTEVQGMFGYYKTEADALKNPPPYPPGFTPTYNTPGQPSVYTTNSLRYDAVKDSGTRESFETGSKRDTRVGKGRYDLFSPIAMSRLARHYENGAAKYGDRNWEKGQPQSRFMDSALRHLYKHLGGARDEDHLSAAAWNVLAMIHQEEQFAHNRLPQELNDLPAEDSVCARTNDRVPGRESPSVQESH